MAARSPIHVAIALDGAGAHPGAWRSPGVTAAEVLTVRYWTALVTEAEEGLIDAVTIDDSFAPAAGIGRLDAVLTASRVAPLTRRIGLIPTATVTHTEPFHVSKAIATLDFVSGGRAGVALRVTADPAEAAVVGRRTFDDDPPADPLLIEARDYAHVLRLLWDSWEDDAEIRDVASRRFIDRDKLHYIDFEGQHFSVRGPSITPRPPQGRPLIAGTGATPAELDWLGAVADLAFVPAATHGLLASSVATIQAAHRNSTTTDDAPVILVDLEVVVDETDRTATDRLAHLDEQALLTAATDGSERDVTAGSVATIADRIEALVSIDGVDGVRLRPADLSRDLTGITRGVIPELQRRILFRDTYDGSTLRDRFARERATNLFTAARHTTLDDTSAKAATA